MRRLFFAAPPAFCPWPGARLLSKRAVLYWAKNSAEKSPGRPLAAGALYRKEEPRVERYFKRKNLALAALLLLGLLPIALGRVPELPLPARPARFRGHGRSPVPQAQPLCHFLFGHHAVCGRGHFVLRRVFGPHGAHLPPQVRQAGLLLGAFIFLSGVWVLTDSSVLDIFVATANSARIVHLLSFLSFMLLPLLFLSFLRVMEFSVWGPRVFDALLMLNFACFVLLTLLPVPRAFTSFR